MPSAWRIAPSACMNWRSTEVTENLYFVEDEQKPIPSPKTALVRLKAAALNARDAMVLAHSPAYPSIAEPNLVPAADGAGLIEAVGAESRWRVGQKVLLNPLMWFDGDLPEGEQAKNMGAGNEDGTLREYAVMPDNRLVLMPDHLSFAEAAALPMAVGTAANALFFGPRPFAPGMTVLTQGTGGVSSIAMQLASAAGATVLATSSSDAKLVSAHKLGATHLINYNKVDWANEVLRITGGKGVDHVLDVAGLGTIEYSLRSARGGGLVSLIGFLAEGTPSDLVPSIIVGAKVLRGVLGFRDDMLAKGVQLVNEHQIRPPISMLYKWRDAKAAYEALISKSVVGKIVIEVGDE